MIRQQSITKTAIASITGLTTCHSSTASAMSRYRGTDPRKSVLMPRAIALRSRVLGNWQARFWRPVERGDPSAEFNEPHGDHLTGPEVGRGVFGDSAQLLIDLIEQGRDQIEGDHGLLRSWQGVTLSTSLEKVHAHDNKTSKYYRVYWFVRD
jgi:hypothetical protein